ncbi:MAG: TlpA disulfide reductase family protein [Rhizobiaceae bacterium]
MSDDKQPKLFPAPKWIALAAVAGLIAGAAAVYVTGGTQGNMAPEPAAEPAAPAVAGADDAACVAKSDQAKAVAAEAKGQVAAMLPADPPKSLKALAFNSPDTRPMTLADRAGKTMLMNLWATWCAPCRAEMPALDALQKEKGGEKFEVIAVNVDTGDDTKPKKFLSEIGVESLGYYRDNTLALFETLKKDGLALGLPVTLLIDKDGCLLASMNGPAEWSGEDAKRLIDKAVGR